MRVSLLLATIVVTVQSITPPVASADSLDGDVQKAVLITGASTGIGRRTTEQLAGSGYFVYAGARKESDIRELSAIENVRGIRLDVTRPEDISAAVSTITRDGRALHGIVNNAGITSEGFAIDTQQSEFDLLTSVPSGSGGEPAQTDP